MHGYRLDIFRVVRRTALVSISVVFCLVSACEPRGETKPDGGAVRIVSLSPAITQMVIDLGFGARIVACGDYDPIAPTGAKLVGDLYKLDYERLLNVRPTHIFMQPGKQGVPATLKKLSQSHGWQLHDYVIKEIDDVLRALHDSEGNGAKKSVGAALKAEKAAAALARDVRLKLERLGKLASEENPPKVLLLFNLNPLNGVGPKTFLDSMLKYAGGRNALSKHKNPYPALSKENVIALAPEVIVFVFPSDAKTDARLAELKKFFAGLPVPAVRDKRVVCLADKVALLPSTAMPRIAGRLACLLHPDLADRIDKLTKASEKR